MTAASTPLAMFRTVVGVGMLCALLIVGVYEATALRIADNEARALESAVLEVLPQAKQLRSIALSAGRQIVDAEPADQPLPAFLGYDDQGDLVGAAITAAGMGYQDTIEVIYAYSFEGSKIVGMRVLQSLETPGLGTRIETDPDFTANFDALDVAVNAAGSGLRNPLTTVPQGTKTEAWQIDAITGATVSSEAVGDLLNQSAQLWVPVLVRDAIQLMRLADREEQP